MNFSFSSLKDSLTSFLHVLRFDRYVILGELHARLCRHSVFPELLGVRHGDSRFRRVQENIDVLDGRHTFEHERLVCVDDLHFIETGLKLESDLRAVGLSDLESEADKLHG